MAESRETTKGHEDAQALYTLAELLERALDTGAPAVALRYRAKDGWQVLLGDPEGKPSHLTRCGQLAEECAQAMLRQTVDGLNVLVIKGEKYRFARAEFQIGESMATIFVPG